MKKSVCFRFELQKIILCFFYISRDKMTVHVAQKRKVHLKILSGEKLNFKKCNPPDFNFIPVKNNLTKKFPYGAMLICVHFHCSKQYMKTKKI